MLTVHAWFSADHALRYGSSIFRKPNGNEVNVTRIDADKEGKAARRSDDIYLGEVVRAEDGGRVRGNMRVNSITRDS